MDALAEQQSKNVVVFSAEKNNPSQIFTVRIFYEDCCFLTSFARVQSSLSDKYRTPALIGFS